MVNMLGSIVCCFLLLHILFTIIKKWSNLKEILIHRYLFAIATSEPGKYVQKGLLFVCFCLVHFCLFSFLNILIKTLFF